MPTPTPAPAAAPPAAAPANDDEYQLQRSRNGCLTCRARRVKCDEVKPQCGRCKAGGRECGWGPEKAPNPRKRKRKLPTADSAAPRAPSRPNGSSPEPTAAPSRAGSSSSSLNPSTKPVDWISANSRKKLMMDPSAMTLAHTPSDEMLTFRHYIGNAEDLIAFNSQRSPFNPWVTIHAPLAFRYSPGTCDTTDALRTAMLAVGAVRLRFIDDPTNQAAACRVTAEARKRVLSLLAHVLADPEKYEDEVETAFAALLSITVSSSLSADNGWDDLLTTVLNLIDRLGGAQKILASTPRSHYSVTRFVLEQLAIRDVIACMTLGRRPSLIRQPFEPWFFEIEQWSGTDVEWESVERMFGVTRGMVDVMARACSLIGIARESTTLGGRPPRELQDSASGLLAELQVWDHGFNFSPYHSRTQYGNHCFRHAMRIALLRDVLGLDQDDEKVVSSARAIIELARELDAEYGPLNWLLWPLLLAGFHIGGDLEAREPLLQLLEHPGPHMCFDTRAGIHLLKEYWRQQDAGGGGSSLTHWQVSDGQLHRNLFAG
ncbi:hypothetical protein VHUM_03029 [Vanrija humicola]|uniref:Zn(2)-C6 fungal-type domain-containing protein n=1 Tax=Vanrija humicola TaxID=5417 RepID=A0A7D8YVL7_VANHU|nr:hypothetical protein VHUM_03029 [Vanrija humicola]